MENINLREDKADGEEECGLSDQLHKADVETQMRQVGKQWARDRDKDIDRDKSGGEETKANTKTETKKETERRRGETAIVKNMSTFQVIQFETKLAEITIPASKMRDGENRFVSL